MFKILVAEDEPKSRSALVSRLRGILGDAALIEAAADGNEAVDKALHVQPELVFMDIEMPYKNGLETAAVIKRQIPQAHVVFLTAYDRFDYAVGAIRTGGEDYLLKPVGETELREILQKFFHVETDTARPASPFEAELTVWVQQHYAEDMALEDAAESMGMSPFYFSRQVKAVTGKTFLDFFTSYRIEKAKKRLTSTELSVSEVARSVGYPDSNYFAKVFKRTVGCTPTTYRNTVTQSAR